MFLRDCLAERHAVSMQGASTYLSLRLPRLLQPKPHRNYTKTNGTSKLPKKKKQPNYGPIDFALVPKFYSLKAMRGGSMWFEEY